MRKKTRVLPLLMLGPSLFLVGCNGTKGGGETVVKEGIVSPPQEKPETEKDLIEEAVKEIVQNPEILEDVAEVIDEDIHGTAFQTEWLGPIDQHPYVAYGVQYVDQSNLEKLVAVSQSGVTFAGARLISVDLDTKNFETKNFPINRHYHFLRKGVSPEAFYYYSQYPVHVLRLNFETAEVQELGELFTASTQAANKRRIHLVNQQQDVHCGTLSGEKLAFHKGANDTFEEFSHAVESIKAVYCLPTKALLLRTPEDQYHVLRPGGAQLLADKASLGCGIKLEIAYRNGGAYLLCYSLNEKNKSVYVARRVKDDGNGLEEPSSLPPSTPTTPLRYVYKLDNVSNADYHNPGSLLHYKLKTDTNWSTLILDTELAPKKVVSMKAIGNELWVLTNYALHRYKDNTFTKFPIGHTPASFVPSEGKQLLISADGIAKELDPTRPSNEYVASILKNVAEADLNPVPLPGGGAGFKTQGASVVDGSMMRGLLRTSDGELSLESLGAAPQVTALGTGLSIIHQIGVPGAMVAIVKNPGNLYTLNKYGPGHDLLHSIPLNLPSIGGGRLSVAGERLILITASRMAAFDLELSSLWVRNLTGRVAFEVKAIGNGSLIGVIDSRIVLIDPQSGLTTEVHTISPSLNFHAIELTVDEASRTMLLNLKQDKLLKIKLPLTLFTGTSDE